MEGDHLRRECSGLRRRSCNKPEPNQRPSVGFQSLTIEHTIAVKENIKLKIAKNDRKLTHSVRVVHVWRHVYLDIFGSFLSSFYVLRLKNCGRKYLTPSLRVWRHLWISHEVLSSESPLFLGSWRRLSDYELRGGRGELRRRRGLSSSRTRGRGCKSSCSTYVLSVLTRKCCQWRSIPSEPPRRRKR